MSDQDVHNFYDELGVPRVWPFNVDLCSCRVTASGPVVGDYCLEHEPLTLPEREAEMRREYKNGAVAAGIGRWIPCTVHGKFWARTVGVEYRSLDDLLAQARRLAGIVSGGEAA